MMPHCSQRREDATTEHTTQKARGREDTQASGTAMQHLLGEDGQDHLVRESQQFCPSGGEHQALHDPIGAQLSSVGEDVLP